jgi:hypothetical protein
MPKADKIRFTKFLQNKDGLISEHFSLCVHLPKNVQTHYSEHNPPKEKNTQESGLAHFLEMEPK